MSRWASRSLLVEGGTLSDPAPVAENEGYVQHQSLSEPPEVARYSDGELRRVTSFTAEALEGIELGQVEELEVTGSGEAPIQVYLVSPPGESTGPLPLVHLVHGGPHGTFGDAWHNRWNAHVFAARRAVALVNFHGSTGFGEAFTTSIHGAWGEHPTADVLAVTDDLIERGVADPDRMAVAGGSYGGYLTCWITGSTDRFTCAVAHAAVTDLPAMYASDWTTDTHLAFGAIPGTTWIGEPMEPFRPGDQGRDADPRCPWRTRFAGTRDPGTCLVRDAQGQRRRSPTGPLSGREPLDPQATKLAPLVRRGAGMARPVPWSSGGRRKTEDGMRTPRSCRLWLERWSIGVHCQESLQRVTIQHPPLHLCHKRRLDCVHPLSGSWLYSG